MIFISSFGMLAETASKFIQRFILHFEVMVFEFAGLDRAPLDMICDFMERIPEQDILKVEHVVAHSAGGIWAFEAAKWFEERTGVSFSLWLLDSHIPSNERQLPSQEELFRFMIEPFRKMLKLPDASMVPKEYLRLSFESMLKKLGFSENESHTIADTYSSTETLNAHAKMNCWVPNGSLSCTVSYVQSADGSREASEKWQPFFVNQMQRFETTNGHFDMLEEAAEFLVHVMSNK